MFFFRSPRRRRGRDPIFRDPFETDRCACAGVDLQRGDWGLGSRSTVWAEDGEGRSPTKASHEDGVAEAPLYPRRRKSRTPACKTRDFFQAGVFLPPRKVSSSATAEDPRSPLPRPVTNRSSILPRGLLDEDEGGHVDGKEFSGDDLRRRETAFPSRDGEEGGCRGRARGRLLRRQFLPLGRPGL